MQYYLGIDIGKRTHVAAVIDEKGRQVGKPLSFSSTREGWQQFVTHLEKTIDHTKYSAVHAGCEATGHYWISLYAQLEGLGIRVSVLNPLEVKAFRNEGIRGNKTDRIDAVKIAKLLRFGDYRESHVPSEDIVALRQLTRLRVDLAQIVTGLKQKVIAVLDQTFPEYQDMFSDTFGASSLELLSQACTPEKIAAISTRKLTKLLRKASRGRFGEEKAQKIHNAAKESMGVKMGLDAFTLSLEILLSQIEQSQKQLDKMEDAIEEICKRLDTTISSIPGIGNVNAGVILAEIGDIKRFDGPDGAEKLVALAGLDPKIKQSGTYTGKTKMSKRGSPYLRYAIRQASFIAVTVSKDPMFSTIYHKQIAKGKHMEVALSHVGRKMLHVIYALMKSHKLYAPHV